MTPGTVVAVKVVKTADPSGRVVPRAEVLEVLALPSSARAISYAIACSRGLNPGKVKRNRIPKFQIKDFPIAVEEQVQELLKLPSPTEDKDLKNLLHLPFVTIDNQDSRDLDQALYISRVDGGYNILYALADASYYAPPGSPLFKEALKRGTSYYLPGLCIPMMPKELSEGLISLNEGGQLGFFYL